MRKISNNAMIAAVLMATMGTTSAFAVDKEFHDGYYFGGSLGKAVSKTKPSGAAIPLLKQATVEPVPGATFELEYKNADVYGILGGYKKDDMRYEFEYKYARHKVGRLNEKLANGTVQDVLRTRESHVKYHNIGLSVLKDFPENNWAVPYVGAGVGVARFTSWMKPIGAAEATIKNTKPTAQLIAGARVPITDGFHLAADYRYWSTLGKVGAIDKRFSNHSINLGFLFQPRFL